PPREAAGAAQRGGPDCSHIPYRLLTQCSFMFRIAHLFPTPTRAFPGAIVGMKPPQVAVWMLTQLGARSGDELVDLYPGSGAVGEAWRRYAGVDGRHVAGVDGPAARDVSVDFRRRPHQMSEAECTTSCDSAVTGSDAAIVAPQRTRYPR
ncbi:MAG: hypothetical protein ACLP8S_13745, partial [Solirubrobacteraceae bacterium]